MRQFRLDFLRFRFPANWYLRPIAQVLLPKAQSLRTVCCVRASSTYVVEVAAGSGADGAHPLLHLLAAVGAQHQVPKRCDDLKRYESEAYHDAERRPLSDNWRKGGLTGI